MAILGPTATGKSDLAVALAEEFAGEIVNADSRQVYRGMDIGTAKPDSAAMTRVPHHLYDLADPWDPFTLADWLAAAEAAIAGIAARGQLPLVVGGTGLYVAALLDGLSPPAVPPDPEQRRLLETLLAEKGPAALADALLALDPAAGDSVDLQNPRRVIRALELVRATGQPIAALRPRVGRGYDALRIGIRVERAELDSRIARRAAGMMEVGLIRETAELLNAGATADLPSMSAIGYAEAAAVLAGELSQTELYERMAARTRRFARKQSAWFRESDARIQWVAAASALAEARGILSAWLGR